MPESTSLAVEKQNESISLNSLMGRLAHAISKELSPGDRADLRRAAPGDFGGPAFWKLAASYLSPNGQLAPSGELRDRQEQQWLVILSALAHLGELHSPGAHLGAALAGSDFSELRLTRLLRAEGNALLNQVRLMVHFLASKAAPVNTADIAWLVLSDNRRDREQARRNIARSYYAVSLTKGN